MSISHFVTKFTQINKWLAFASLVIMMVFVAVCAAARGVGHPIVGDIELVQLSMVSLIVGALAYTQHHKAHISIGIIADHFPQKIQCLLDLLSAVLTTIFALLVAYVFFIKLDFLQASTLLRVPFYIFEILLIIGFVGWGLESIKQMFESVKLLFERTAPHSDKEENSTGPMIKSV